MIQVINDDCLSAMAAMQPNSIDCILTDPPYGLSFMGKDWDKGIPGIAFWQEAIRVCKPGAMMLVFGGTRTYHRLACAIEDAGWEIRDCLMWVYGSGFPKSHNHFGLEGYGTALKPAYEPVLLCMKPLEGTFAQNAEKWGVAGINIDACRIGTEGTKRSHQAEYPKNIDGTEDRSQHWARTGHAVQKTGLGRWPANLLLNEEAAEMLDEQSGYTKSTKSEKSDNRYSPGIICDKEKPFNGNRTNENSFNDSGGASRFFYCAKASSSERNAGLEDKKCSHPTVKPLKLLEYLLKFIMPPNPDAIVLDPFLGSGSTLVAAKRHGYNAVGIEISKEYCEIAEKRIAYAKKPEKELF